MSEDKGSIPEFGRLSRKAGELASKIALLVEELQREEGCIVTNIDTSYPLTSVLYGHHSKQRSIIGVEAVPVDKLAKDKQEKENV